MKDPRLPRAWSARLRGLDLLLGSGEPRRGCEQERDRVSSGTMWETNEGRLEARIQWERTRPELEQ